VPQGTARWHLQEGVRCINDFEWGSGYHKDWKTVPPSTDVEFLRAITLAKYQYTSTDIQYAACMKKTTRNVRTRDEPTELRTSKHRTQASTFPPNPIRANCMNENGKCRLLMWRREAWQKAPTAAISRIWDIIRCTLRMQGAHCCDTRSVLTRFLLRVTQPSGYYTYCTTRFNIRKIQVLPTQCIYVFCVDLRTTSDHFPIFYVLPTQCIYVFCGDMRTNSDYFPIQH
jgi:hypothetical protein